MSDELKIKLVNSLTELSYRTAGKLIPPNGHTLSPATVFNILNKSSIKVWYKPFTKVNKTIHVQIDEKYVSTRSNKYNSSKRRIYTGCIFDDIDTSSSRHRLVDRTIASSRSQSDFFRKLNLTLKNQYNVKLSDKIYISGDLATYIQNSNEKIQVCSACYVPDKFHVTKLFLKFFGVKLTDSLDSFIKDVPIYIKTLLEMPESIKSSTDYKIGLRTLLKKISGL